MKEGVGRIAGMPSISNIFLRSRNIVFEITRSPQSLCIGVVVLETSPKNPIVSVSHQ